MLAPKRNITRLLTNAALSIVSLSLVLFFAEVFLRNWKPHDRFYSLAPEIDLSVDFPATDLYPGLPKQFTFTTNHQGHRSANLFEKGRYGILAIGGSTTECTYVGDENLWTNLLEAKLNQEYDQPVTIGNVGVASLNSEHHLLQLQHLSPQYEGVEAVLILVGVNDFLKALYPNVYMGDSAKQARRAFSGFPRSLNNRWYKRTELWMHLRDFKINRLRSGGVGGNFRQEVSSRRTMLAQAKRINTLPDLSVDLERYENTITKIYEYCQTHSKELILVTQPLLWNQEMPEHDFALTANGAYFSADSTLNPGLYHTGISLYNKVLQGFDSLDGATVIDLAATLPQDTTVFYDYCHFNIRGSHQVADIIFQSIQSLFDEIAGDQHD